MCARRPMVLSLLLLLTLPLSAQSPPVVGRGIVFSAAFGPSEAARGVDASGAHADVAIGYRARSNGLGVWLEQTGHHYRDVPLYPCLVQDDRFCYQTMRRRVTATIANVSYTLRSHAALGHDVAPYLVAGLGNYRSRRIATRYSDCQPGELCDRSIHRLELRDEQLGTSGGVGAEVSMRKLLVFAELRVHYAHRDTPAGEPSNDYFMVPLSLGIRF